MRRLICRLVLVLLILSLLPLLAACSAFQDADLAGPPGWVDAEFPYASHDLVAGKLTALVRGKDYGYRVDDRREFARPLGISLRTEWNNDLSNAQFAGYGVRRRMWAEVFQYYVDFPQDERVPVSSDSTYPITKVIDGRRKRLVTKLSIGVASQANNSIMAPDNPEGADWGRTTHDEEESARIMQSLQFLMRRATGQDTGISKETERAYREYLLPSNKTPEESAADYERNKRRREWERKQRD